jgi:hypothetical protein
MRLSLIPQAARLRLEANAAPIDRTPRIEKSLAHCKAEWQRAYDLAQAHGKPAARCVRIAAVAYKLAMPNMTTANAVKAAIACVAQGINLEVFDGREGSQLLYAAQVALTLHRKAGGKP